MLNKALRLTILAGLAAVLVLAACSNGDDGDGAVADATDRAGELLQEGLDAHAKGDLTTAEARYHKVLEVDSGNAYAYYNLGLIEQTDNRMAQAEAQYRQALALDSNLSPALFNLAIVRTQAGALDEAVSLYQRAAAVSPDNAATHLNLGLLLDQLNRPAEAEQSLARASQLDPAVVTRLSGPAPAVAGSADG